MAVRLLQESEASGAIRRIYEDTRATFGVPWVGVIIKAFAAYEEFLKLAWSQFKPSASTSYFEARCEDLRSLALYLTGSQELPNHLEALRGMGFREEEIPRIVDLLEVFHYGNPKFLLFATAIRLSLDGQRIGGRVYGGGWETKGRYAASARPAMVEESEAAGEVAEIYGDIKATLRLPFVNSDYKALAAWPEYLKLAWETLKRLVSTEAYRQKYRVLNDFAISAARALPYPFQVSVQTLTSAGYGEEEVKGIRETVNLFQGLLPGLILNIATLRHCLSSNFKERLREAAAFY